ncbi:epoxide hydrolase family protein [Nocardia bhagyanarayanae]|uniref:Pimeloyl-ACP methyl ester carboxylesterase n=1 Tax=Nocardia bhagyanarayanae TaxID=1215925 RepID=A0A543F7H2_9NOCA|nr:epoxide hydrolase family protein [Nocardia bhagyanarayanae]TQM29710.1 pimeloyl-ACP methyl ester carboxylesterase [Nocardia bhagyanarayanae]
MSDNEIRPFRIDIPQTDLDDLRERLARTRWIDEVPAAGWERGVPTSYLRDLTAYWTEKFDWRAIESRLNAHPQFTTTIDGQNLHFLHIRSHHAEATPLLLIHGWPGTAADFLDLVGPLTDPAAHGEPEAPSFHLVIPTLPGHGFSGALTELGWHDGRVAATLAELMARLGYERYGVHGGDHGAFLAPRLGREHGEHVLGVHANALVTFPTGDPADMAALTDADKQRLAGMKEFQDNGSAYMSLAGSRPNTLAQLLADSPVGQLGWIVEKYKEWTDAAGELPDQAIDRDKILTTVTIYWLTDTARSVANYYYERFHDGSMFAPKPKGTVPTGVAVFTTADFAIRRFAEKAHNIVHWSEFYSGGHFPALEVPDLLAGDLREFFGGLTR